MYGKFQQHLGSELTAIKEAGLYKSERLISGPQGSRVRVGSGDPVLNLCANNYLGLAQHPEVNSAAKEGLNNWGYGVASVAARRRGVPCHICQPLACPRAASARTWSLSRLDSQTR